MAKIQAKKSLGQNFLIDKNISNKIVNNLACPSGGYAFEIGPGTGALTELLLNKGVQLTAIELDKRAVEELEKSFPTEKYANLTLLNQDFLKFDIWRYYQGLDINQKLYAIGNIPYNISSKIFFALFDNASIINEAVLMIQKEVAQRLVAKPKSKAYGILTVAIELIGSAKILFDVPPSCFHPRPKVTSSIIKFNFDDSGLDHKGFKSTMAIVRAAFNQRRKTLRNALKSYIETKTGEKIDLVLSPEKLDGIDYLSKRAEELTKDDYLKINSLINS